MLCRKVPTIETTQITYVPNKMSKYHTLAPLALSVKATTHGSVDAGWGGRVATHRPSCERAVVLNFAVSPPDREQFRKTVTTEPPAAQPHTRAVEGADCNTACSLKAFEMEKRDAGCPSATVSREDMRAICSTKDIAF